MVKSSESGVPQSEIRPAAAATMAAGDDEHADIRAQQRVIDGSPAADHAGQSPIDRFEIFDTGREEEAAGVGDVGEQRAIDVRA